MTRPLPIPARPRPVRPDDVSIRGLVALVDEGPDGFGIIVADHDGGGVWHPDEDAAREIRAHRDPDAAAVRMCRTQPMRGSWHL